MLAVMCVALIINILKQNHVQFYSWLHLEWILSRQTTFPLFGAFIKFGLNPVSLFYSTISLKWPHKISS